MKLRNLLFLLVMFVMMSLVGCADNNSVDTGVSREQENRMQEAHSQAGLPAIKNFNEKKMMKMLYELRDQEDLVCHAYYFNEREGKRGDYIGQCLGYGLPASTQYSNPEKMVRYYNGGSRYKIAQAEPNGLFMPEGLSATWLMMIDPKTKNARPVYIEPLIIVSPFRMH